MRKFLFFPALCLLVLGGCEKKPQRDYSALDNSGMYSTTIDELKKVKVTDPEVAQLAQLKQGGASDELCMALYNAAHSHNHDFTSGESAVRLSKAGYSDAQILEMANSDQIDILATDAVMLKLIGISNPTVQEIIHRRMQGLPTMTSEQIGRLKNTAMSEKQILEMVESGVAGDEAEAQIKKREASRNHSHTDFVRNQGRRRR